MDLNSKQGRNIMDTLSVVLTRSEYSFWSEARRNLGLYTLRTEEDFIALVSYAKKHNLINQEDIDSSAEQAKGTLEDWLKGNHLPSHSIWEIVKRIIIKNLKQFIDETSKKL